MLKPKKMLKSLKVLKPLKSDKPATTTKNAKTAKKLVSQQLILFLPKLYGTATSERFEIALPV